MNTPENNNRIKDCRAVILKKSFDAAFELLSEQGKAFIFADTEEEAKLICTDQAMKYYMDKEYELGSACLLQMHPFKYLIDASAFVKGLCELGDHYYYDRGENEKALICFQLATGLDSESGEAHHGAVTVLGQGMDRCKEAFPYAVLADLLKPGQNAEGYLRWKLRDFKSDLHSSNESE